MTAVGLIDTTLRDGQQSLWATRMTTAMMLPILPTMDAVGFASIEHFSTVHFDVCVRYLKENPWERMRLIRAGVQKTPIRMLGMSQFFSISRVLPDDVVELFTEVCVRNGVDEFWITASMNDPRTSEVGVRTVKRLGRRIDGGIQYTVSPVHTDEFFVGVAKSFVAMGVDGIVLKDAGGLLTAERAATLVPALVAAAEGRPVICHSHCVTGLGPAANLAAVTAGADAIWTCTAPLANGASMPSGDSMARHLDWMGYDVAVDREAMARVADHFQDVADRHRLPTGRPAEYDPAYYEHQMPGGMISNFQAQLAQLGLQDRLPAVLAEIPQVRQDLGWPNMQTPYSQFIATQALLNVLHGRYEQVPDEIRNLVLGYWGRTPAPVDPDVLDRVGRGAEPITVRPGSVVPPALERLRAERPGLSDEDLLLSIFFMPAMLDDLAAAGPMPLVDAARGTTVVDLVRQAAAGGLRAFELHRPG
ncbi:MAG TPA: pyruvate carboxylase subunit B [Candidatus Saccharimonadales bacterium]|nr:pyruvate carboxylase subunit B [Candidatus Saccharimonadales bacterium]